LDDLAESFFMSALHNGQIRTMKANYKIEAGDIRVIRPFVYVREAATRDFSMQSQLPIINENCPACFEQPKERHRIKKLLSQEEAMVPALFYNLRRAFLPLLHDDTYEAMQKVSQSLEEIARLPKQDSSRRQGKRSVLEVGSEDVTNAVFVDEEGCAATIGGDDEPRSKKKFNHGLGIESSGVIEGDNGQEKANTCSTNGGYCPPCYEIF
jgi:hypothetical protein